MKKILRKHDMTELKIIAKYFKEPQEIALTAIRNRGIDISVRTYQRLKNRETSLSTEYHAMLNSIGA